MPSGQTHTAVDLHLCHTPPVTYPALPSLAPTHEDGHSSEQENISAEEPKTPSHPRSNIGRRRVYTPSLARSAPSQSHSTKMAAIFRDAQASIKMPTTPCQRTSPNSKASRIPLSQRQLASSGSPVSARLRLAGHSPKIPDPHSSEDIDPFSITESDKENQSPGRSSLTTSTVNWITDVETHSAMAGYISSPPNRPKLPILPARELSTPVPTSASPLRPPSTPSVLPSQHPRRKKKQKTPEDTTSPRLTETHPARSRFNIKPDDDFIAQLSPDVTPYRKDNRPKRTRCVSYFDTDILGSPSPTKESMEESKDYATEHKSIEKRKGKVVLGESEAGKKLTKQKAFVENAEGALFFGETEG
ncbi:MAG: hypothetical protein M1830_006556 [Pleopsidium flavum]|nr:MAG: hypothetical protein M1830_006556 [Pleopsidium flavum]